MTPSPERASARLATRQIRRGALILTAGLAGMVVAMVSAYDATGLNAGGGLARLTSNPAIRAVYGVPFNLDVAGGFAVWRAGIYLGVIAATWALLTTTRLLRGEEEWGRWELVLSAPLPRRRLIAAHLAVIAAACAVLGAAIALAFIGAGQGAGGGLLFGAGLGLVALLFCAVGAVTSQLFDQRRQAAGVAGAALGASLMLRMLADGSTDLGGLRWLTPLGWLEELRAFAADRVLPLGLMAASAAALFAAAFVLAERRDLGAGVLRGDASARPRLRGLRGTLGFAARERLPGFVGWTAGVAAFAFVTGLITNAFTEAFATDADLQRAVTQAGFAEIVTVPGFVATMAGQLAVIFCAYAVVGLHVMWADEESERIHLVLALPVPRTRLLAAQGAASATAVLGSMLVAALALWLGVVAGGVDLAIADVLASIANTLPVVALFLALAVLAHGVRPQIGGATLGALVGAFYVLSFLGPILDLPGWVMSLSPFDHLALVPIEPADWDGAAAMVAIAAAAALGGFAAYRVRDLR
jgi:ABC-2 type transport system permease protein